MTGSARSGQAACLLLITAALGCSNPGRANGQADATDPCRHPAVPNIRICCGMPGELQGSTCVPRQLIEENLANCVTEGRAFDAKFSAFGLFCCEGLTRIEEYFAIEVGAGWPDLPAGCTGGPPSVKRCTKCGDGSCGAGENRCNCPADCQP